MVKKLLFTLFLVLVQTAVFAQTNTYIGSNNGDWNTASNWSLGLVPTASHDAVIPSGKTVTISANASVKTVSISGTLKLNDATRLTLSGDFTVNSGGSFLMPTGSGLAELAVYGNYINNGVTDFWKSTVVIAGDLLSPQTSTLQKQGNVIVGGNIIGVFDTTGGNGTGQIYAVDPNATVSITPTTIDGNVTPGVFPSSETSSVIDLVNLVIYGGSCTFTITDIASISSCSGSNAIFTVSTNGSSPTYLWQVNTNGSGWVDLANGAPYSGVTTSTLTISGVTSGMNNYKYRAKIKAGSPSCTKNGNYGVLTVNTTPSQPTLSTPIQPTCTTSNGSFTIANYNASYTYTVSPSAGVTVSGNTVTAPTGSYTVTATLGTCTSVASSSVVINSQPAAPVQPTLSTPIQPTCTTSNGSFTIANYNASYTYTVSPSAGVTVSGNTVTAPTGSYTVTAKLGTCTSVASSGVVINSQPAAPVQPTLSTPIQLTCTTSNGSFTIANYNASYTYTVSPSAGVTVSGNTVTAPTGSYTVTATLGTCTSVASASVTINAQPTNTWNGSAWSTGLAPTSSEKIIFDGFYSSATNLNGCSCQVNSGKSATILSGGILKITNELTVLGTGTLTFENNSSLVQINDAAINTGNIIYRRQTTPISKFDYTYWSSPVSPQTLYNVSPNTLYDKFFSYNAVSDIWTQENPGNNMVKGAGYIIRGPQNYAAPTPPGLYEANFKGVPNNGIITIPIGGLDSSNLIGNPYPSALDANKFLTDNSAVLDGTLYFWTHNTAIQLASGITNGSAGSGDYAYTSDDYASYNLTGGVGTDGVTYAQGGNVAGTGGQKPSGKIASGQGFFATGKSSGTATFNNSMRVGVGAITGDNSQFFKMTSKKESVLEKHRIWLNLTNTQGAFKQMLLGYVTNATNGYDNSYDGESFDGNTFVDFYTVNDDKNLTIQGRALPFDENDVVPIGFSSTIEGVFSIGIDEVDGLFTSQGVFLEDTNTNTVKNLKEGAYTFTTVSGTFNDRFVLRFINANKTLETNNFDTLSNRVLVSNKNKQIKINSSIEMIDKIQIYDLLGRKVYEKINVNANELSLSNLVVSNQVLLVKIILENDKTITKKIIY